MIMNIIKLLMENNRMIFYKKFLQIFLTILLLLTLFPMENHAETTTSGSTISGVISEDRVLTKEDSTRPIINRV
jgi:hypothetical protein